MRMDKLTTKFQMALSDAQSLAIGHDHQFMEPAHVIAALLDQQGATVRHLLAQAGVNVNALRSQLGIVLDSLPQVAGVAGDVQVSSELGRHLNLCDKLAQNRKDQFISSELFVLACFEAGGRIADLLERNGASKVIDRGRDRRDPRRRIRDRSGCGRAPPVARKIHHRSHRARRAGQARSSDRT